MEIFQDGDIDDREWLAAASKNEVFKFLNNEPEDLYDLNDGKPIDFEVKHQN